VSSDLEISNLTAVTSDTGSDQDNNFNDDLNSDLSRSSADWSQVGISSEEDEDSGSDFNDDSDVSGCPSCGNDGEMSSDESDDEDFELIIDHRDEMENDDMADDPAEDLQLFVI
jgi:hypothetical protein